MKRTVSASTGTASVPKKSAAPRAAGRGIQNPAWRRMVFARSGVSAVSSLTGAWRSASSIAIELVMLAHSGGSVRSRVRFALRPIQTTAITAVIARILGSARWWAGSARLSVMLIVPGQKDALAAVIVMRANYSWMSLFRGPANSADHSRMRTVPNPHTAKITGGVRTANWSRTVKVPAPKTGEPVLRRANSRPQRRQAWSLDAPRRGSTWPTSTQVEAGLPLGRPRPIRRRKTQHRPLFPRHHREVAPFSSGWR